MIYNIDIVFKLTIRFLKDKDYLKQCVSDYKKYPNYMNHGDFMLDLKKGCKDYVENEYYSSHFYSPLSSTSIGWYWDETEDGEFYSKISKELHCFLKEKIENE